MRATPTAAILLSFILTGPAFSQGAPQKSFPHNCAARDLDLVTEIEASGNAGTSTTKLVLASEILQAARAECADRSEANALSMYSATIRMLQEPNFAQVTESQK